VSADVKLELKKPLLNYDGKPIKSTDDISEIQKQNPTLSQKQLIDKCPNMIFGNILPHLLLQVPSHDPVEKLKLFRWASKINDKMITNKGEMTVDLNQVTELFDFVGKVQQVGISVISPILIYLDELKEQLKTV